MHDLGATLALIEVVKALMTHYHLQLVLSKYSKKCFEKEVLKLLTEVFPSIIDMVIAREYIAKSDFSLLITGTSWRSNVEQIFRNTAYEKEIPSVVYIDYWSNYKKRFDGAVYSSEMGVDTICVLDSYMKTAMAKEGFNAKGIYITGSPFFRSLVCSKHELEKKAQVARCKLRDSSDQKIITFFSEHITQDKISKGYVLSHNLIEKIEHIMSSVSRRCKMPIKLIIKIHPREERDLLEELGNINNSYFKSMLLFDEYGSIDLILASDLVIGQTTASLVESRILGKPAVSILQNNKNIYSENFDRFGIPVIRLSDLENVICNNNMKHVDLQFLYKDSLTNFVNLVNRII
jgi:hypothetical protein